jgi:hypothetical protein
VWSGGHASRRSRHIKLFTRYGHPAFSEMLAPVTRRQPESQFPSVGDEERTHLQDANESARQASGLCCPGLLWLALACSGLD